GSPWREIAELEVRAEAGGQVEALNVNHGGWLEEGELALSTVDPVLIRFHADAPQSDMAIYRDGQKARIVPGQGGSVDVQQDAEGTLTLGLTAHPVERTISLYVQPDSPASWARAGVSAYLEVTVTEDPEENW